MVISHHITLEMKFGKLIDLYDSGKSDSEKDRRKVFQDFSDSLYTLYSSGRLSILDRDSWVERPINLIKKRGFETQAQELANMLKSPAEEILKIASEPLFTQAKRGGLSPEQTYGRFTDELRNPALSEIDRFRILREVVHKYKGDFDAIPKGFLDHIKRNLYTKIRRP